MLLVTQISNLLGVKRAKEWSNKHKNTKLLGFVTFVLEFKYLGSLVHHSLTSDADVNKRIMAASAAFGALRSVLCNFALSENLRGQVYTALVLTILLYGCEVWCLREDLFAKLRTFHNSCCRAMCRITMAHTIRHHIPSKQLRGASLPIR